MGMTLKELMDEAHKTSVEKGWHDQERSVGDWIALAHSELSEGLEAERNKEPRLWFKPDGKPEGLAAEYADVLIRIADHAVSEGMPLEDAIIAKLEYNKTRPYRHGGKAL